jgi:N-acetylneuraminate synthase
MNDLNSISKAVEIIRKHNLPLAILHTTNLYPTPNNLVRLGALEDLKSKFRDTIVGLSDHTLSNHSSFGAIALGASIIERHYTDTKDRIGPDIVCSMDEKECNELIEGVKILFEQRGGKKEPVQEETETAKFAFASIVAISDIRKGEVFSMENVWVKRPGTGPLKAEELSSVIGKISLNNIKKDEFINNRDFE